MFLGQTKQIIKSIEIEVKYFTSISSSCCASLAQPHLDLTSERSKNRIQNSWAKRNVRYSFSILGGYAFRGQCPFQIDLVIFYARNRRVISTIRTMAAHGTPEYPATVTAADAFKLRHRGTFADELWHLPAFCHQHWPPGAETAPWEPSWRYWSNALPNSIVRHKPCAHSVTHDVVRALCFNQVMPTVFVDH